jgi:hypothetical protein
MPAGVTTVGLGLVVTRSRGVLGWADRRNALIRSAQQNGVLTAAADPSISGHHWVQQLTAQSAARAEAREPCRH